MIPKRRYVREAVLEATFQLDFIEGIEYENVIDLLRDLLKEKKVPQNLFEEGEIYLQNILENKDRYDEYIKKYLINWDFDRVANIEKTILRLAIFELEKRKDIPPKVILDEAVELAKKYSNEKSAKFINGILDKIAKEEFKRL
ncbi:antitermination protein NusB [Marinitoga sp. 1135]|uniref:Transcription antitermination protein NusB n=1 Tax=Marinitoga piezophila (strain DSM 14283 / JCM 11233 / KA3) TaxID=443254 RepID=H2J3P6_MARPK|nr:MULTISPECIES: transcription antitermination factor NusB [Marinitoga]AEX84690.1 transcription antitermination factor NusB [Marinitoga piezophila KA3]APT75216.1 antitermination protein NusB [Marinitoga sp. 1137]NUU94997.1 antitermination protein NusB [Marinitoga sp. 1135]NUU96953.1 antitermination protein NusB [Marinitoga sp. 1138]